MPETFSTDHELPDMGCHVRRRQHLPFVQRLLSVIAFAPIACFAMLFTFSLGELAGIAGQPPANEIAPKIARKIVESLATVVKREYFDPNVGSRVEVSLRERLAQGRYDKAHTLESLANMLTRDLFDLTHDKHLNVAVMHEAQSTASSAKTTNLSREARGRRENFGVQRVEILAGNVGYLNLTAYYRPDEARDTLSAAMRTLQYADAIILDMRSNSGGSPETVALLTSYFFDTPRLPLFTIVDRSGESRQYFTEKTPLKERDESRPVYVLTSKQTFSAGEGTAFLLQERQRAEVVGETTAGAANPGQTYPVNSRFEVTVPNGKLEAAVTRKNWESCGVKPDVAVPASDALRVAHARALRHLLGQSPNTNREELKRQLRTLEATKH
jgi:hypothetical protein